MPEKSVLIMLVVLGAVIWLVVVLFILKKIFESRSPVSEYQPRKKKHSVKKKKSRSKKR